jgi:hypothetical protein
MPRQLTACGTLTGVRVLPVLAAALLLAGCGAEAPAGVRFTRVELPPGAVPTRIAVAGDGLVVGVRANDAAGMLRYAAGRATEIPLTPATSYGAKADWFAVTAAGDEVLAVGGRTGGAHGNNRWSVWRTTPDGGLAEQPQSFNTFGGTAAGQLVAAALPTTGPLLVGTWASRSAGADVMTWTTDGTLWTRRSPGGTPLESTGESLKFPMAAAAHGAEVVIAGWQLAGGRQQPVVWTLRDGSATMTPLPDAGRTGMGMAVTCEDTCDVAGRVDGGLALWRRDGDTWRRLTEVPEVPVGDRDRPVPPLGDTLVYSDRGTVHVATLGGDVRDAVGPTGVVTAVARVDDSTYVLAGPEDNQTLWRAGQG